MCTLLPQELAGMSYELGHPSGEREPAVLPELVSPTLPATNISSIKLNAQHAPFKLEFAGDTFHMEDQRNWTDASYKIYSGAATCLAPFEFPANSNIEQTLRITASQTDVLTPEQPPLTLGAEIGAFRIPEVGTTSQDAEDYVDFVLSPSSARPWSDAVSEHVAEYSILADLNSSRPSKGTVAGVAFGAQPQTHAFDDRTIMENVHALLPALATVRAIAPDIPVYLGPVVFSGRDPEDERFGDALGQAWLAACIVLSAVGGANAISIAESGRLTEDQKDILATFTASETLAYRLSSDPYRVIGARLSGGTSLMVNMTPYLQIVSADGQDVELQGFEVQFKEPSG
jgi:hypothetical protein